MTEDTLKYLSLDAVSVLMQQSIKELKEAIDKRDKNEEDETAIENKKKQIELIQRVLIAKRAEFPPG